MTNSSEGSVDFKSGDYASGLSVTFTATPNVGYISTNWANTVTNHTL